MAAALAITAERAAAMGQCPEDNLKMKLNLWHDDALSPWS